MAMLDKIKSAIQPNLLPLSGLTKASLTIAAISSHAASVIDASGIIKPKIKKTPPVINIRLKTM